MPGLTQLAHWAIAFGCGSCGSEQSSPGVVVVIFLETPCPVIFWDVEDMAANQSEAHQSILKKMMPLFALPETTVYVVCEIKLIEEE